MNTQHKQTFGLMWEYDHARPLGRAEYEYWTRNVLPFGWSIIKPPQDKGEHG